MLKLENIESKTHVLGIEPTGAVRVIDVETAGPDAVNVSYKLPSGQILQKTLFRADEERLSVFRDFINSLDLDDFERKSGN